MERCLGLDHKSCKQPSKSICVDFKNREDEGDRENKLGSLQDVQGAEGRPEYPERSGKGDLRPVRQSPGHLKTCEEFRTNFMS